SIPDLSVVRPVDYASARLLRSFQEARRAGSPPPFPSPPERINAVACALDFLRHYETEIAPRLAAGRLLVCDRYAPCYLAYALACDLRLYHGLQSVFSGVVPADRVVYLSCGLGVLRERLAAKRPPEHQPVEKLLALEKAYGSVLEPLEHVVRLRTDGPLEECYAALREAVLGQRTPGNEHPAAVPEAVEC
ncbi:MAG TPA: hypothetical protein VKM72_21595, partial [Thermoanaerobaculia bacterium]|nr:hypothetical protein [Thermoanaerobaculia bacterium]